MGLSSSPKSTRRVGSPWRKRLSSASFSSRRNGFALVSAILLIAFLVVLLLTLGSLIQVGIQTSAGSQRTMEARQNALYGLQMAVGELQKQMGPDQRISAPSSLGATDAPGEGVEPRLPHVTGVWMHDAAGASSLAKAVRSPKLLSWLVSGNEKLVPGDSSYVTPSSLFALPTPENDKDVVWLVGRNSVEVPSSISAQTPDPRIRLRTSPVNTDGRYAWWIGDEGTKARIDIRDPFAPGATLANNNQRIKSAQTARFDAIAGLEALTPVVNSPVQEKFLSRNMLFGDADLLGGVELGDQTTRDTLRRSNFHALTAHSMGLLTDSFYGGLRRDLSQLFALSEANMQGALKNNVFSDFAAVPAINTDAGQTNQIVSSGLTVPGLLPEFPKTSDGNPIGPTWEQLRSFGNIYQAVVPGLNGREQATARPHLKNQHGIEPVLLQAKLFFGIRREPSMTSGMYNLYIHYYPMFILANPYTVDLAPGAYHVTLRFNQTVQIGVGTTKYRVGGLKRFNEIFFKLEAANPIPAGGASVFTLKFARPVYQWEESNLSYQFTPGATYEMEDDFSADVNLRELVTVDGHAREFSAADAGNAKIVISRLDEVQGLKAEMAAILWSDTPTDFTSVIHTIGVEEPSGGDDVTFTQSPDVDGLIKYSGGFSQRHTDLRDLGGANMGNGMFGEVNMRALSLKASQGTASPDTQARYPVMTFGRLLRDNRTHFDGTNGWFTLSADKRSVPWLANYQSVGSLASPVLSYENQLFHIPRSRLNSLAQLQHFNASGFLNSDSGGYQGTTTNSGSLRDSPPPSADVASYPFNSFAYQPPYPIGNSRASKHIPRDALRETSSGTYTDASFLLNQALWDRFFFSSLNYQGSELDFSDPLNVITNKRYSFIGRQENALLRTSAITPSTAASLLGTKGAFNINSVSVAAWAAFLSGLRDVPFNNEPNSGKVPFPRSEGVSGGSDDAASGVSDNAWKGFRSLDATQITRLANEIVKQVRLRGPFVSLADFVNRRLVSESGPSAEVSTTGIDGALAAAITASGLNNVTATGYNSPPPAKSSNIADPAHQRPHLIVDFPGWLTQADVLQAVAPYLSARSDTFVIRSFGEIRSSAGKVEAKAWCEAVVQRRLDYVDPSQPATTPTADLNQLNKALGRRFEIVSFRWLAPDEI